jgi:signal peptidase II
MGLLPPGLLAASSSPEAANMPPVIMNRSNALTGGNRDFKAMLAVPKRRIAAIGSGIFVLDQFTKWLVLLLLGRGDEKIILDGFFKFVHWGNTGAAWSLFRGNNAILAAIALAALVVLFLSRHHFDYRSMLGQVAFGLIFGGIAGNLTDRILPSRREVIDFIYFYLQPRGGGEIGFPAFNIADSAICIGVGLIFYNTWKIEHKPAEPSRPERTPG